MVEDIKLKMEKNLAVIELNQTNILSQKWREEIKSYIEKIIKSSSIHVSILSFQPANIKSLIEKQISQGETVGLNPSFKTTPHTVLMQEITGLKPYTPYSTSASLFRLEPHSTLKSNLVKTMEKIHGREKWERLLDEVHELLLLMEKANVSWIAAIHGACLGSQLGLALACDYRIADFNKNTVFGFPELLFGLIPGFGGCIRLPYLIGVKKTLDMILKSRIISAPKAYQIQLISGIVHPLDLEKRARSLAEKIIKGHIPPKPPQKYKPLRFLDKLFEIPVSRQILYYRAKKKILKETKSFYPAPLKTLEVIKNTYPAKSLKIAIKEESDIFCDLIVSPITKHLMSLHLIQEKIISSAKPDCAGKMKDTQEKDRPPAPSSTTVPEQNPENKTAGLKKTWLPKAPSKLPPAGNAGASPESVLNKKIAVIGAGVMGGEITHWLVNNMVPVLLKDIHAPSLSDTLKSIYSQQNKQWSISKIRPQMDYSGFSSVDMVIETVVEDMEIKKEVISETASHLSDKCLFATNTSSFSITELAKAYPDPSRFLGLHFFYPVQQTPLVEVVSGAQSANRTVISAAQWMKALGKIPLIVKDNPGFLVHRLLLPLISEAFWLLHEGVTIQQVDKIYSSFGFSMGPFRLMDELGLDICLKLIKSFRSIDSSLDFPPETSKLRPVFLGKKNKIGFYIYNDKLKVEAVNHLIYQDLKLKSSSRGPSEKECLERGLYRMIKEAARALEGQIVTTAAELDLALILGIGFPAFRGGLLKYADEISLKTIIADLSAFSQLWGKRFQPSPELLKQAETGKKFYKT